MNILKLLLGCVVSGLIALFTTSVFYVFIVSLLVFIVLLLISILKVLSFYNEVTNG
jgi:TM2 domain-containing membrane protein YozV